MSKTREKRLARRDAWNVPMQVINVIVGLVIAFPIIYAFFISFMPPAQVLTGGVNIIPKKWTLENYVTAFTAAPLMRFMLNSFIIAFVSSLIRVIVSSLAAFAFAFLEFRFKNFWFMLILTTMMIPADVVLVANYQTVSRMGLINTYLGMMIVFFVSAINIFQLRQSFKTFATSLKEASHIDGCSNFRFFCFILLPTNISTILTVFITAFIGTWNTYLWPLMVTNQTNMRVVQVGVTMLNFSEGTVYGPIMAASMIILLPTLILFLTFQKKIVAGMMAGGVKG
ncbi:MAG: carbohydrate ABC transporter permease [Lachnospiraceae bacterium]